MALNQYLFNRLRHCFGEVGISDEGAAMVTSSTRTASGERRLVVVHPGEYYRVNCPFCVDGRKRLWVNHRFGTPDPYSGRPLSFLATCFNEGCLAKYENLRRLEEELFALKNRNARPVMRISPGRIDDTPPGPVPPPGELIPVSQLPDDHPAVHYLVGERNFSREVLDHYGVSYCVRADPANSRFRPAEGRIIIPIYQGGEVMGWQARYIGTSSSQNTPKYFTCPGMKKSKLLYNLENARTKPFVVVVEGPTDVWRIGDFAVAMLGVPITLGQRQLLYVHWARRPTIFLLEAEKQDEMIAILHGMAQVDPGTPIAWGTFEKGCDPGSLTTDAVWNIIRRVAQEAGITLPST